MGSKERVNNTHSKKGNNHPTMVGIVGGRTTTRVPTNALTCLPWVRQTMMVGNGRIRFLVRLSFAFYLFLLSVGKLRAVDRTKSAMERSLESFQQPQQQQKQQTKLSPSPSSSSTFGGRNASDQWIPRLDELGTDNYDMDDDNNEKSTGCLPKSSGLPRLLRERAYTRVPGYIRGCDNVSFYGYVMRDFAGRFLSTVHTTRAARPLLPLNVLVASSPWSMSRCEKFTQSWVSNVTMPKEDMIREIGYDIGGSFFIEATLAGHRVTFLDGNNDIVTDHFDPAEATDRQRRTTVNDETIFLAVFDPEFGDEDDSVQRAFHYIRSGSIEYAVVRIASATQADNKNIDLYGLRACGTFLDEGYRLQVLSSSHVSREGHNDYGPNTLLKNTRQIENFLRSGAQLASEAKEGREAGAADATFQSFLFATRGLELAIPSRKEFLNLTGFGDDDVIDVKGKARIPYLKCPTSEASIKFTDKSTNGLEISCFGTKIPFLRVEEQMEEIDIWHGHPSIGSSEAACVRCKRTSGRNRIQELTPVDHVACTTRVLKEMASPVKIIQSKYQLDNNIKPNLVMLELKGINQHMLSSSLPAFQNISESTDLIFFPNYVGIRSSHHIRSGSVFNMSHDLINQGYRVFQVSNQCKGQRTNNHGTGGHSSLLWNTSQLQRMFCFDYDRPNCLGNTHTASYLFDYATQFIDARHQQDEPWAALLTLVDGQEETETVIGTLDSHMRDFILQLKRLLWGPAWSNTVVAVYSDVNAKPVLYLKARRYESIIRNNREKFVSPLDLLRTLHNLTHSPKALILNGESLIELLPSDRSTCDYLRRTIDATCDGGNAAVPDVHLSSPSILSFYADMPRKHKLQLGINRIKNMPERAEVAEGCLCSTNVRAWFACDVHPWEGVSDFREYFILVDCPMRPTHLEIRLLPNSVLIKRSNMKRRESGMNEIPKVNVLFLEIDSASVEYADRHFPNTRELLRKYRIHRHGQGGYDCANGLCSADFSFMSLVGANSIPNQVAALSGCLSSSTRRLCGLDPNSRSSIGQVCNDPMEQHFGLRLERVRIFGEQAYWCPDRSIEELKTPWLFGVTDSVG